MRRYLYNICATALLTCSVFVTATEAVAQERDRHDVARYGRMNQAGVWSVGVHLDPVSSLVHPLIGGGRRSCVALCGAGIEGGYVLTDGLRLSVGVSYADSGMSVGYIPAPEGPQVRRLTMEVGGHWHSGRWDFGGGVWWGRSRHFSSAGEFLEGRGVRGLRYDVGWMLSPFMRVGAYYCPGIACGGGYAHQLGLRMTIHLSFTDAVVCR